MKFVHITQALAVFILAQAQAVEFNGSSYNRYSRGGWSQKSTPTRQTNAWSSLAAHQPAQDKHDPWGRTTSSYDAYTPVSRHSYDDHALDYPIGPKVGLRSTKHHGHPEYATVNDVSDIMASISTLNSSITALT